MVRVHDRPYAGTGVIIARDPDSTLGLVLTNHHVIEAGGRGGYSVEFAVGGESGARLLDSDPDLDIAALLVYLPEGAGVIPLAESVPPKGAEVVTYGNTTGRVRRTVLGVTTHNTGERDTLGVSGQTISGDSGGAIVHEGELVGVLWGGPLDGMGGRMTATHGAHCKAIRGFLGGVVGRRCPWWCEPRPIRVEPTPTPIDDEPPVVTQPPVSQPPAGIDLSAIEAMLDAKLAGLRGEKGEPGERGPAGPQGEPGAAAAMPDVATLQAMLDAYLATKPITVRFMGDGGKVLRTVKVPIGGTLDLPPMEVRVIRPDGTVRQSGVFQPLDGRLDLDLSEMQADDAPTR